MVPESYQACISVFKNRVFLGQYTERRHVPKIDAYRDVIVLHDSEEELQSGLKNALKSLQHIRSSIWIGFTCSTETNKCSLWVELSGVAFGHYWFQVKHVRVTVNELFCQVKVLRSVQPEIIDSTPLSFIQGFERARKALTGMREEKNENVRSSSEPKTNSTAQNPDYGQRGSEPTNPQTANAGPADPSFLKDLKNVNLDQIKNSLLNDQTRTNMLRLILLCFFYTLIGFAKLAFESLIIISNLVVFTGDITIKGLYAFSRLIESVSPLVLAVINVCGKMVTGLYILIALLCGCTPYIPQEREPVYNQGRNPQRRAIKYR